MPGIARDDEGRVTVPVPLHDTATELDRLRQEELCHEPCLRIYRFKQQLHRRRPVMDRDTTGTAEEQSHARWVTAMFRTVLRLWAR